MAKNLIMEPVNNSQADGNSMKKALRSEEEF
jgi:hypothetical protein